MSLQSVISVFERRFIVLMCACVCVQRSICTQAKADIVILMGSNMYFWVHFFLCMRIFVGTVHIEIYVTQIAHAWQH